MNRESSEVFQKLLERFPALTSCALDITRSFSLLRDCRQNGGVILICGNGGSASDADHITGELMKGFRKKRPLSAEQTAALVSAGADAQMTRQLQLGIPAVCLSAQTALVTAIGNDLGYKYVFAQQILAYGRAENCLWAISTSGNSASVVNAVLAARSLEMKSVGLTGGDGGKLAALCDAVIRVPGSSTEEIQELHLPVYHAVCAMLEAEFFPV